MSLALKTRYSDNIRLKKMTKLVIFIDLIEISKAVPASNTIYNIRDSLLKKQFPHWTNSKLLNFF